MANNQSANQQKGLSSEEYEALVKNTPQSEYAIDITDDPRDRISQREFEVRIYNSLTNLKLLTELKKDPICQGYSDKHLMLYLFGRKLDLQRAIELLTENAKWRQEHGYPLDRRIEQSELNQDLVRSMYTYWIPGTRDKEGRLIGYILPGRVHIKKYTLKEQLDFFMWCWDILLGEGLDGHRKGVVYIEDIHGVSLSSFDRKTGADFQKAIQKFPIRIQAIYVIGAGWLIRTLLAFAKLFMKEKIIGRTQVILKEEVMNFVEKDSLDVTFGGTIQWNVDKFLSQ